MGVLAELETPGFGYDMFVGVSATSVSAVLLAQDRSAADVAERTMQFARRISLARDFGPTSYSFTTGRSLTAAARTSSGEVKLEHLRRPCRIGATSLTDGGLRGIAHGHAWKAIRASASLPIIFPPMRIDGELMVDGGVVDNVPTSLAYDVLPDPVVTAISANRTPAFDVTSVSNDGIAGRALLSGDRRQFLHLMTACLRPNSGSIVCDQLIEPAIGDSGLWDASQFDDGFEQGRIAGRTHVESQRNRGHIDEA